jgi:4-hydroxy-tetrahydrodipicolinate synthase
MTNFQHIKGVYTAALTPLKQDFSLALDDLPNLLEFYAQRGCVGALLFGTTGEGPSFAPSERHALLQYACQIRQSLPGFCILAGTGTPSLEETIELTRVAFDVGVDGVVVLPPYYFRGVTDEGLFIWYSQILRKAVPSGSPLLGYHFPAVSGVPLTLELISLLLESYPDRFAGIKDSSGDPDHARKLGQLFGTELIVLTGNDSLFSLALQNSASGCITAMANLCSPDLRRVWDGHLGGNYDENAQNRLNTGREYIGRYTPFPPLFKTLIAHFFDFPKWTVRPPLLPLSPEIEQRAIRQAESAFSAMSRKSI